MKHFLSDQELLGFARQLVERHIERFEKDIAICLTPTHWKNGPEATQAYFPALITCIGFMDFFSGLYGGNLNHPRLNDLKSFARRFLPSVYTDILLTILYQCFRHKVAHLAHPYDVLDTENIKDFEGEPPRRITWSVSGEVLPDVMLLESLEQAKILETAPRGWGIRYDHIVHLSLPMLARDSISSARNYLQELENNQTCQQKFQKCMIQYFCA